MLFPRLQRQDKRPFPVDVRRLADDSPGQFSHQLIRCRHKAQIGPSKVQIDPEGLTFPDDNIRFLLARALDQGQGHGIGNIDDHHRVLIMDQLLHRGQVLDDPEKVWILQHDPGCIVGQ